MHHGGFLGPHVMADPRALGLLAAWPLQHVCRVTVAGWLQVQMGYLAVIATLSY